MNWRELLARGLASWIFLGGCAETDCVDCIGSQGTESQAGDAPQPSPKPSADVLEPPTGEPYGNCTADGDECGHGITPHCLVDDVERATMAFCTSDCTTPSECPDAPIGSTAVPNCLSFTDGPRECVLDCFLGQTCPSGMVCLPYGVCGHVTADADNPYGQCDRCPDGALGCLATSLGEVCLPRCSSPCPSPRNGSAISACIDADGEYGCALVCDGLRQCPDGMRCAQSGFQSLCVWEQPSSCASLECGRDAECEMVDGQPVCVCNPGFTLNQAGECVNPCAELYCHPTARCELTFDGAVCVCEPGESMDPTGRCVEESPIDPCDPNPCVGPASRCVSSEEGASCQCPDPSQVPPYCEPMCTLTHFDGDEHEPNDCPADATLIGAGDAGLGLSRISADIGPNDDDLDLYRLSSQPGVYWLLLEAEAELCALPLHPLPESPAFGGFGYAAQFSSEQQGTPWACSLTVPGLTAPFAYSLGAMHFEAFGDLPPFVAAPTPGETAFVPAEPAFEFVSVADRFEGADDVDALQFSAELPLILRHTGQHAALDLEVLDLASMTSEQLETQCEFSLEPLPCQVLEGSGSVIVTLTVRESPDAEQTELDAWRLEW